MDRDRDMIQRSAEDQWAWFVEAWPVESERITELLTRADNKAWSDLEKERFHALVALVVEAQRILVTASAESLANILGQLTALTPIWRDTYRFHEGLRPVRQLLAQLTGCLIVRADRYQSAPTILRFLHDHALLDIWRQGELPPATLSKAFGIVERGDVLRWPIIPKR